MLLVGGAVEKVMEIKDTKLDKSQNQNYKHRDTTDYIEQNNTILSSRSRETGPQTTTITQ